jgi:hypothetical protein
MSECRGRESVLCHGADYGPGMCGWAGCPKPCGRRSARVLRHLSPAGRCFSRHGPPGQRTCRGRARALPVLRLRLRPMPLLHASLCASRARLAPPPAPPARSRRHLGLRHSPGFVVALTALFARPARFTTGNFTISNLGMYGVETFDAILPPGEARNARPSQLLRAILLGTFRAVAALCVAAG